MNWKLRLKNKATLTTLVVLLVTFIYGVLAALGITPSITQDQTTNLVVSAISVLVSVGVVVDPTTQGMKDSTQAMGYNEPKA